MYVDGRWGPSESGETFAVTSPSTGEAIATAPRGTRADAGRAIAAANAAAPGWAALSAFERAAAMERVAAVIDLRRSELARALSLDQGKPLVVESQPEVEELIAYWRMAAADAVRLEGLLLPSVDAAKRVLVYRVPRGVVGVITPWNWPYTMAAELIAPALAAGNTVVWNPASSTPLCSVRLAECIAAADLPAGVFNMVTGPGAVVGDEMAGHPGTAAMAFIGSTGAGLAVARRAAGKDVLLEMGGNGPLVVLDDADLDKAVTGHPRRLLPQRRAELHGRRAAAGPCRRPRRVPGSPRGCHARSYIQLGDPFDGFTTMGPLNNEAGVVKMERHVADALARGASLVSGGRRAPQHGSPLFYEATILDGVTAEMEVAREETFGPVVPITTIGHVDEAVEAINSSPYGLLAAVFTADVARGLRFAEAVRAGWVNINEGTNYWESHLPFGGRAGSQSGVGRVGGRFSLERMTELKTVVLNLG